MTTNQRSTAYLMCASFSAIHLALLADPAAALDKNLTWKNAPAPAHKLYLTDEEFRGLFPEKLQADAGFCRVPCSHNINGSRPDGRPFINGHWETDRKTGKTDFTYRPGRSTLEKGAPYFCHISAYYRYAPPDAQQPRPVENNRPYRRLDMTLFTSLNAAYTAQSIREWQARDAKSRREQVRNPKSTYYKYRYVEDLGFGLDRNDMFVMQNTNGKSCQVFIQLDSAKLWFHSIFFLHMEDGAVSVDQAVAVARNAAAILAKKGYGAQVKLAKEGQSGAVGLLEGWIADSLGKTPEEDRRAGQVSLGKKFYITCAYKLPEDLDDISITFEKNPGQDAVAASRERFKRMNDETLWIKPLDPGGYRALDIGLNYSSRDKNDADGSKVKIRKTAEGMLVVSFLVDTSDPQEPYVVGPGSWEFLLRMKAIKRGGPNESDHELEISTQKVNVTIADDPAFSARFLKPAEKP
ncbi:MAG: hypothetical protein LLG01_18740 [Planctomycetaceae bacterium]|nr:hypothetical protein [Planctomycetaceae bacterium]